MEKKAMQEEINGLKIMLRKALTDHMDYVEMGIVHQKAQLMKTEDLQVELEQTKKENEALKLQRSAANRKLSEMEAEKAVGLGSYLVEKVTAALRMLKGQFKFTADPTEPEEELKTLLDGRQRDERCNLEELEISRSTFLAQMAIHEEDDRFMPDRLLWEEENSYMLEENRDSCVAWLNHQKKKASLQEDLLAVEAQLEETKAPSVDQLNQQKMENEKLQNALKETEDKLKTQLDRRQRDKICHLEELKKSRSTFLVAIHKKETDQFMADRLQWEQEKASLLEENRDSCVTRLNHQKEEVDHFAAALRNAEQHFEGFREWREEKSSLTRAMEELKQTMQKKEQESVSREAVLQEDLLAVKTQLEDLQRKVAEKKRNKWYRFSGTLFTPRR